MYVYMVAKNRQTLRKSQNDVQDACRHKVTPVKYRFIHGNGWQRIHIDFAGPVLDKQFLVIVDTHSKWPEVFPMSKITTTKTIELLQTVFARNGLPE